MRQALLRTTFATAALCAMNSPGRAEPSVEERLKTVETRLNTVEAENKKLKGQLSTDGSSFGATSGANNSRIGGYGELHYNNLDGKGGASDKNQIDFHRFVLFFGHTFNESTRFFSELELEHSIAGEGKDGEIELEQAYVERDINADHRVKAGLFLVPVGIINETHEPPVFYGVERNPVEKDIIPATWWAGGVALSGQFGNSTFSYDLALHEGLATEGPSYKPRNGRQKTSEALANDPALTARLKWTGIPGVELGGAVQHQSDITQGRDTTAGSANLVELHAIANMGSFGFKALYAQWDLDGSGPAASGADKQMGWYLEPSVKLSPHWGLFARYNLWDNTAGSGSGTEQNHFNIGASWWPHPDVVFKAGYQKQDNDDGKDQNGFNLGVGYQF